MRRAIPTLLAVALSGASVEEATSATCRDIERWSELQDVLGETRDNPATYEVLTQLPAEPPSGCGHVPRGREGDNGRAY
jgi:hypothetical protein